MPDPRAPRPNSRYGGRDLQVRRTRLLALGSLGFAVLAVLIVFVDAYAGSSPAPPHSGRAHRVAAAHRRRAPSFAVGTTTLHLVDTSRTLTLPDGQTEPRPIETVVRYPALGGAGGEETPAATPATAKGPYPLIVFGHGFDATPTVYAALLNRWTRAGYVVAAPIFPLENSQAPGGASQADLINEPADMSFVISHLIEESGRGVGAARAHDRRQPHRRRGAGRRRRRGADGGVRPCDAGQAHRRRGDPLGFGDTAARAVHVPRHRARAARGAGIDGHDQHVE